MNVSNDRPVWGTLWFGILMGSLVFLFIVALLQPRGRPAPIREVRIGSPTSAYGTPCAKDPKDIQRWYDAAQLAPINATRGNVPAKSIVSTRNDSVQGIAEMQHLEGSGKVVVIPPFARGSLLEDDSNFCRVEFEIRGRMFDGYVPKSSVHSIDEPPAMPTIR